MVGIIEFLFKTFGAGGNIVVGLVFFVMTILGVVIAMRGMRIMSWLVSVCAVAVGVLAGAMTGILVFDSFILMLVFSCLGGALMLLLMKYLKGPVYFISISMLGFFLAYVMTSEMYITNTKITENTLLLADIIIAIAMGFFSVIESRFFVTLVTAVSGGMIISISILGLFGCYFSDWKTWAIAILAAGAGMYVQIASYPDSKSKKIKKK